MSQTTITIIVIYWLFAGLFSIGESYQENNNSGWKKLILFDLCFGFILIPISLGALIQELREYLRR